MNPPLESPAVSSQANRTRHLVIALVGQPNSGKSTIFNHVSGYRALTSNFSGTTVTFTESHIKVKDRVFDLIDLPGIYSLNALDEVSLEAQKFLVERTIDVLVHVIDSSILGRSLELTIELLELGIPMVLDLNMFDEAQRKGIEIDPQALEKSLGVPVVATVARTGEGIKELFDKIYEVSRQGGKPRPLAMRKEIERGIELLAGRLENGGGKGSSEPGAARQKARFTAVKLLEGDPYFEGSVLREDPDIVREARTIREKLARTSGRPADCIVSSERHSMALDLFEDVAQVKSVPKNWADKVDDFLLHSFWGYFFLAVFVWGFFNLVFKFGTFLEKPLLQWLGILTGWIGGLTGVGSFPHYVIEGVVEGITSGIGIIIPFLVPFFIILALVEDIGYLPRISYLLDLLTHRLGLHGTAVIPIILGYGCSVPAVMATRILPGKNERFIASTMASFIPCSARIMVIMGLVGTYLGGNWALSLFITNLVIVVLIGHLLSRLLPIESPGLVLEIPPYRLPTVRTVSAKVWFRLKSFVVIAWPLLIAGSIVLSIIKYFGLGGYINNLFSPLTGLLGLPASVGLTLVFGVMRKELTLLMLGQALGTRNILEAISPGQVFVFTVFVLYYIPCIATLSVMVKELGKKKTAAIVLMSVTLALVIASAARWAVGFIL